jgi:hypothetical protein
MVVLRSTLVATKSTATGGGGQRHIVVAHHIGSPHTANLAILFLISMTILPAYAPRLGP